MQCEFMKKIIIASLSALLLAGCSNADQTTANANLSRPNANNQTVSAPPKADNSLVVSSH
jgi:PBP1b-binding outer membrane lipoprotein LpoB